MIPGFLIVGVLPGAGITICRVLRRYESAWSEVVNQFSAGRSDSNLGRPWKGYAAHEKKRWKDRSRPRAGHRIQVTRRC